MLFNSTRKAGQDPGQAPVSIKSTRERERIFLTALSPPESAATDGFDQEP